MDIYQQNYRKLLQLIPTLHEIKTITKFTALGFMDLHIGVLNRHNKKLHLSISQFCEHPLGHMVADPCVTITVCSETETIEALTFQNYLSQRQVYRDDMTLVSPSVKMEMNLFLGQWLTNLLAEGQTIQNRV